MSTIVSKREDFEREIVPAGNHIARCIKFMHFGHVPDTYMGERRIVNKCRYTWELPGEMRVFDEEKGEQPMSVSKDYTVSLGDRANLRKDLESWRGKAFSDEELQGFDISKVVGVPCMLNVIHKESQRTGKTYAVISSITPIPKGVECPPQINPSFTWDYNENFDEGILENLNKYFQDIIKGSEEYENIKNPKPQESQPQDVPMPTVEDEPMPIEIDDLPF